MVSIVILGVIILVIALVVGGIVWAVREDTKEEKNKFNYTYKRKDFLMSKAEYKFFDILVDVVEGKYYVFPQIHLSNILDSKVVGQNWYGAFRHIDEKSVDFVICDKAYIKPLLAIELDDRTHERENRKERDIKVENILNGAGMPFLRFSNNGHFNKEGIKRSVFEKLK